MRIATFNVNSVNARLKFVLHWLAAREPTVACLQELKLTDDAFPTDAFTELGYEVATHGQPKWNGVAILSRSPIEVRQRGLVGAEDAGARLITAETEGLVVTSVYVPNGKTVSHADYQMKLAWLDALDVYLDSVLSDGKPHVVGGDFNICPAPVDTHAPDDTQSIFHTSEERDRMERLMSKGLTDLYRHHHPDGKMFSWWDYRAGAFHKNMGLRIDLLLGTANVVERVTDVVIDRDYRKKKDGETPSDHAPVMAELKD